MRVVILFFIFLSILNANFSKDIEFEDIKKDSVVKFELDDHILRTSPLENIIIKDENGKKMAFSIKDKEIIQTKYMVFSPIDYKREDIASITFQGDKKAYINKINLEISDMNFKTYIDVYITEKYKERGKPKSKLVPIVENYPIFDYTDEVGIKDFSIKLDKIYSSDEITVRYNTQNSEFFYEKLKDIQKVNRYLTISKLSVTNQKEDEKLYHSTIFKAKKEKITKKDKKNTKVSYLFELNYLPFSKININSNDTNFHKFATIYQSDNKKDWHFIKNFSILNSTFLKKSNKEEVDFYKEIKTKYIKIESLDLPLDIKDINVSSVKKEIYFIAKPNKKYTIIYSLDKPQTNNKIDYIISSEDFDNALVATLKTHNKLAKEQKDLTLMEKLAKYDKIIIFLVLLLTAFLLSIVWKILKREGIV